MSYLAQISGQKTSTGSAVSSGQIGQLLSSNASGVAIPLSGAVVNVTSLILTAGFWQADGRILYTCSASGGPFYACMSLTSAAVSPDLGQVGFWWDSVSTLGEGVAMPTLYVNVAFGLTQTVYICAKWDPAGSTPTAPVALAEINAIRVA